MHHLTQEFVTNILRPEPIDFLCMLITIEVFKTKSVKLFVLFFKLTNTNTVLQSADYLFNVHWFLLIACFKMRVMRAVPMIQKWSSFALFKLVIFFISCYFSIVGGGSTIFLRFSFYDNTKESYFLSETSNSNRTHITEACCTCTLGLNPVSPSPLYRVLLKFCYK